LPGGLWGTVAEFLLGRFLTFNNLSLDDVRVLNLVPAAMSEALAHDQVDAVMVWDPVAYEIKKRLGEKIIRWAGQPGQKFFNPLVTTDEFLKARPLVLERMFRALAHAETFVKSNREESIDIVAHQINLDKATFENDWSNSEYELSFDQSLIIAMEDEARWMISNKLTDQTRLPNFLPYLAVEPMAEVVPRAVQVVIPKDERGVTPAPSGAGRERP
jgi:ABC-type nitrate/sulfonate/bicarbonate transport system substrate-binding protein